MDTFEEKLKFTFLDEAAQMLLESETPLQTLLTSVRSGTDCPRELLDDLYRLAHNLKGSAAAAGFSELAAFTHHTESLLTRVIAYPMDPSAVDLLIESIDRIGAMIAALKSDFGARFDNSELLARLEAATSEAGLPPTSDEPLPLMLVLGPDSNPPPEPELQLGLELGLEPGSESEPEPELEPISESSTTLPPDAQRGQTQSFETLRVSLSRLDELVKRTGELMILRAGIARQPEFAGASLKSQMMLRELEKLTSEIQSRTMSLRMAPIRPVFQSMNRIVRETAKQLDKTIALKLVGEDTELDRTVLERLSDPLMHLMRNAVDHGIELPEVRSMAGKPPEGTIELSARQSGGSIALEIRDDGAGMDAEQLVRHAIEKGVIPPGSRLSNAEAYQLIFAPGFSTKTEISDISGRGVGMDIVKSSIQQMRGTISIETQPGQGTTFKIRLPLTLAVLDGLVVRVGEERYIFPCSNVAEAVRPVLAQGGDPAAEQIQWNGERFPALRLRELLGRPGERSPLKDSVAVVTRDHLDRLVSLVVDDVVDQQSVVVQELDREIEQLPWVMGGAILDDGQPSLILNIHRILEVAS